MNCMHNTLEDKDRQWFQHFCSSHQIAHDRDASRRKKYDQVVGAVEMHAATDHVGPWWQRLPQPPGLDWHWDTCRQAAGRNSPAASCRRMPLTSTCGALQPPAAVSRMQLEAEQMQEAVLKDILAAQKAAKSRADTPADLLLCMLSDMLLGRQPDLDDVTLAKSLLLRHADPYQPLNLGLQMREANLDADVVHALMHQLGASSNAEVGTEPWRSRATGATVKSAARVAPNADGRSGGDCRVVDAGLGAQTCGYWYTEGQMALTEAEAEAWAAAVAMAKDGDELAGTGNGGQHQGLGLRDTLTVLMQLRRPSVEGPRGLEYGSSGDAGGGAGSSSDGDSDCGGWQLCARHQIVLPPVVDEVESMLALADGWQYDTCRLAELTQGHALSCLAFYLLHREGLISQFGIHPTKLARLLRTLESGYPSNPYHNSTHAADVLQTLHVLLHGAGLAAHYLDRLGLMAAYFAAVVHDHGHPGLTADFLIATSDPLAVRYNDRSPLENHHGASFFALLQQPGLDALSHLSAAERAAFRRQVLDLVMATDMKQHFALLAHFNTAHHLLPYNKDTGPWALARGVGEGATSGSGSSIRPQHRGARSGAESQAPDPTSGGAGDEGAPRGVPLPYDETERVLSLQIALKAADLGHLGEELEVHKRWVRSLEEEFFCQGDREQQLGLTISPLFDRSKQGVSKSQVGFYDFIALPLVHSLATAFPGAMPLLACFVDNYDHWRTVERAPTLQQPAGGMQQQQQT